VKRFSLSNPIKPGELEKAYEEGLIRKSNLKDGKSYKGSCRNATVAVWHAEKNCFTYQRTKWGNTFPEDIKHPEDDDGYDLFLPVEEVKDA
jgi:hypothetical protein